MNQKEKIYYKATDADMKCRGYQFELNKWSDPVEGDLIPCKNGYHFCKHPSGVWAYYDDLGTRVFKCKVRDAIISSEPGADAKSVARQVMLVEEVQISGDRNTGYRNTGDCNTGYRNTGDRNTGDYNTGYRNTGDYNTGYSNTGDYNTGYSNTGDYNTGYSNTGYSNTGDYNTGDYNVGSFQSGAFGIGVAAFTSFGLPCNRASFPWEHAKNLYHLLDSTDNESIDVSEFLNIPNSTEERIREFHRALIQAKKETTNE